MVMETPTPQCVGREFVRQYYTLLHEAPIHLHRFYSNQSSFVHGGVDKPGEVNPPVMGQAEIHKKILSLNFRDCHAKIRQVDSQATVGDAVVVQVTGELSNNGEPMRRFMQTFVLVPQSPKKYYVHNDIFRYQDEVFNDIDTDENNSDGIDSESEVVDNAVVEETPAGQGAYNLHEHPNEQVAPPVLANQQQHRVSQKPALSQPTQVTQVTEQEVTPSQPATTQTLSNGTHEDIPEPAAPVAEVKEEVDELEVKEPEEVTAPEPEPEPVEIKSNKPKTWASLLGTGKPTTQVDAQPTPGSMKTTTPVPVKQEQKQDQGNPPPQQQRQQRPGRDRGPREGPPSGGPGGGRDDDIRRSQYPDSHQVFVGNLPHDIDENSLKEFFEGFGKVVELRINKKTGNSSVPNYGFVVFEDEKTTQKILKKEGGFWLQGTHRLNVEEKKQRGEGRPGSSSRMTGPRGMSRGGMGPPRGGRGGMMGPRSSGSRGGGQGFGPPQPRR